MNPNKKAAPGKERPKGKNQPADDSFLGKVDASADERHAELFERAATILSQSVFRNQFSSPDVSTLESALRLLMLDAGEFHRFRSAHYRKDSRFIFRVQDRREAA